MLTPFTSSHPASFTLCPSPPLHCLPHPVRRSPLPRFIHLHRRIWNRHNKHNPSWRFPRPIILRSRHKERSLVPNGRLRPLWRNIRWLALHWLVLQISHPLRTDPLASDVLGHHSHPSHHRTNRLPFGHSGHRFLPKV